MTFPAHNPDLPALTVPVVFIVFNRPDCTTRSLAAIRAARPARLYVVADGPRAERVGEAARCADVRKIVEQGVDWPCEVIRDYAPGNLGLACRVASGLNAVFARETDAIILEDDCVPDPTFFPFCAGLLEKYRDDARVGQIAGYTSAAGERSDGPDYYFSRYPHCWGWATWRRAWTAYDHEMKEWPEAKRTGWLRARSEQAREAAYWERIFDRVYAGEIDSWAYRWTFAGWRKDFLSVLPAVNLVENIGFGAEATHTRQTRPIAFRPAHQLAAPLRHPPGVARAVAADRRIYSHHFDPPLWLRIWRKVKPRKDEA